MTGLAALRAGAGLVTVASAASAIPEIAAHAPELMTEPLPNRRRRSMPLERSRRQDRDRHGPGPGPAPRKSSAGGARR